MYAMHVITIEYWIFEQGESIFSCQEQLEVLFIFKYSNAWMGLLWTGTASVQRWWKRFIRSMRSCTREWYHVVGTWVYWTQLAQPVNRRCVSANSIYWYIDNHWWCKSHMYTIKIYIKWLAFFTRQMVCVFIPLGIRVSSLMKHRAIRVFIIFNSAAM